MNSIKVCEYSRSRSFHDDLILQDQASGERSQDHWSSGFSYISKHYHYENSPMQYTEIFIAIKKMKIFSRFVFIYFLFLLKT